MSMCSIRFLQNVTLAATLLLPLAQAVDAQDTRAIQIREAQRADERTLAYLARFRAALIEKFGVDPWLSMLTWTENEGSALVHASPTAPATHVIWQEGKWINNDGRQLKPWAPGADPAVSRFRLSAVTEKFLRERFRAHRAQPSRATDFLMSTSVGYFGRPFDRVILEIQVGSMTGFGLSTLAFDLVSGAPLDINAAIADARTQRTEVARKDAAEAKAAAQRNLVQDAPTVLAAYRRERGPAKLMAAWIARDKVTFVQADRAIIDVDQRGRYTQRPSPYDQIWLCTDGFEDREVDWGSFAMLIDKAMLARNLDEEDRPHGEIAVERPRECAPTTIEVKFTNYKSPYPFVVFDAAGRLLRSR